MIFLVYAVVLRFGSAINIRDLPLLQQLSCLRLNLNLNLRHVVYPMIDVALLLLGVEIRHTPNNSSWNDLSIAHKVWFFDAHEQHEHET